MYAEHCLWTSSGTKLALRRSFGGSFVATIFSCLQKRRKVTRSPLQLTFTEVESFYYTFIDTISALPYIINADEINKDIAKTLELPKKKGKKEKKKKDTDESEDEEKDKDKNENKSKRGSDEDDDEDEDEDDEESEEDMEDDEDMWGMPINYLSHLLQNRTSKMPV